MKSVLYGRYTCITHEYVINIYTDTKYIYSQLGQEHTDWKNHSKQKSVSVDIKVKRDFP